MLVACGFTATSPIVSGSPQKTKTTTSIRTVLARNGQGPFGQSVRADFGGMCGLSGFSGAGLLLQAAHIKPWSISSDFERLDPENGILLHATLHHAFDQGLISFDDAGKILISLAINSQNLQAIGVSASMQLPRSTLSEKRLKNLKWHRKNFGFPE